MGEGWGEGEKFETIYLFRDFPLSLTLSRQGRGEIKVSPLKKIYPLFFLFLFLFHPKLLLAFPNQERPIDGTRPLTFTGINAQATQIATTSDNRYLVAAVGSSVFIIDLASFSLLSTQISAFSTRVGGIAIQPNTYNLYIVTTDKKMHFTQVNAPAATPTEYNMITEVGASGLPGVMVSGQELGDKNIFFIDTAQFKVWVFDTGTNKVTGSVGLTVGNTSQTNTPTDIDIASFPSRFDTSHTTDRIFVTTKEGFLWFFDEGSLNGTQVTLFSDGLSHNLTGVSIDPTNDVLYVVDQAQTTIDVVSTSNPSSTTLFSILLDHVDLNPLKPFVNINLTDIVATQVINPVGTRVYVSGENGLTIISSVVSSGDPRTGIYRVLDMDGSTAVPNTNGPLPLGSNAPPSAVPGPLAATSANDGYVFASDQGGGISVVSANPFVTINSVTPAGPYTLTNSSFTISFNSDEICTTGGGYNVRANGNIAQSGALLLPEVFFLAGQVNPITTSTIDVTTNSSILNEGNNDIFIFVQDCASQEAGYQNDVGRDMTTISVDLPPPEVTVLSVDFGNQRGIIKVARLTQSDINHYNAFVLPATDQANPVCPGSLDFTAAPVYATANQPGSGSSLDIVVPNLTNGTYYCVAVQAVDNSSQTSPSRTTATSPVLPEYTVGITQVAGEKGCSLNPQAVDSRAGSGILVLLAGLVILIFCRGESCIRPKNVGVSKGIGIGKEVGDDKYVKNFPRNQGEYKIRPYLILIIFLLFSFYSSTSVLALEATPKKASIGFEGGFFAPRNSVLKEFLSDCCNGFYNLYGGALFDSKYEVNLGVGFLYENRAAIGATTGRVSGDHFSFFVIPVSTSFTFRAQFVENQILVPYATTGLDYMYFRQNLQGDVTSGWKVGYHAGGGLMISLEWFDQMSDYMEQELGINDTYLTLGGKWMQIDNFGGEGLKFNGFLFSAGLLFEF